MTTRGTGYQIRIRASDDKRPSATIYGNKNITGRVKGIITGLNRHHTFRLYLQNDGHSVVSVQFASVTRQGAVDLAYHDSKACFAQDIVRFHHSLSLDFSTPRGSLASKKHRIRQF